MNVIEFITEVFTDLTNIYSTCDRRNACAAFVLFRMQWNVIGRSRWTLLLECRTIFIDFHRIYHSTPVSDVRLTRTR